MQQNCSSSPAMPPIGLSMELFDSSPDRKSPDQAGRIEPGHFESMESICGTDICWC